jgi:mono/diheme cytochrome c family protein
MRKRLARLYPKLPPNLGWVLAIIIALHLVPFAIIAVYRTTVHTEPPIHVFLDMDVQPKLKAQAYVGPDNAQLEGTLFADGRAMRPHIDGTVARGTLIEDDVLRLGYREEDVTVEQVDGKTVRNIDWAQGYPESMQIDLALLRHGQQRYNIFCAPCHGESGRGNGMVHVRAERGNALATGWVQPSNIVTSAYLEDQYPNGRMYHIITHGVRSMPAYASQIPTEDRWAIVAYVRALQLQANFPAEQLPENIRRTLR